MTRVLKIYHATTKWVWGSPAATTTASCHQKATPPYGHARKMKISGHSGVYVALEEYAAEHAPLPPPVYFYAGHIHAPPYLKLSDMPAQESATHNGLGTARTNVTQERIEQCELILGAILREQPEFFSVRLDNPL